MDGDVSQYQVDIDLGNPNTSHTQVVELVGQDREVLDIGCWTGDLGRALMSRGCRVTGLEVDEQAADKARVDFQEVVVADLNATLPSEHFPPHSFDAVVLADVLEHLLDPVAVLRDVSQLLAPGGRVVISVPNVTHGSVRLALLQGRWTYTETGLLDATHVKFFSRTGVLDLVHQAGFVVEDLRSTLADPLAVEVEIDAQRLPPTVVEWVRSQPDALAYQFVAAGRPARDGEQPGAEPVVLQPAVSEESVRAIDRHTQRMEADFEERHRLLTVRDHIIGLEAAAATAESKAHHAEHRLQGAMKRLARKNERIKELSREVAKLERQPERTAGRDPVRGALDKLRRATGPRP